jgi:hypothetical protein
MLMTEQIDKLAVALSKCQSSLQNVPFNKTNPYFKNKYSNLPAIWDSCRKSLTENGLSIIQTPSTDTGGRVVFVTTMLLHSSGQYIYETMSIENKTRNKETGEVIPYTPQEAGSAITYLRRYCLASMLGLTSDEDDDANIASKIDSPATKTEQPKSENLLGKAEYTALWETAQKTGFSATEYKELLKEFNVSKGDSIPVALKDNIEAKAKNKAVLELIRVKGVKPNGTK